MRSIPLTQGQVAIVDDEDFPLLSAFSWQFEPRTKGGYREYARASIKMRTGNEQKVYMHRLILNASKQYLVDHKDGNGLNNTRRNLRLCSHGGNSQNSRKRRNTSSRFKGVSYHPQSRKWGSRISVEKKHIWLGLFANEQDAACAYNRAAKTYFGEFAVVNLVQ